MQTNFLTPYEKRILERRKRVKERYIELRNLYKDFSPSRIMGIVAEENEMSLAGVYKLLRAMGVYKKEDKTCKKQVIPMP